MFDLTAAWQNIEFVYGNPRMRWATGGDSGASFLAVVARKIGELTTARSEMLGGIDYSWCADPSNYTTPLEALFQLLLIETITDLRRPTGEARVLELAKPVIVRILPSSSLIPYRHPSKAMNLIVVPTGFVALLREFSAASYSVSAVAPATGAVLCQTDMLRGARAERALRYAPTSAYSELDALIEVLDSLLDFGRPRLEAGTLEAAIAKATSPSEVDLELQRAEQALVGAEMFAICHELAHILLEGEERTERTLEQEIEADYIASSLFIVCSANCSLPLTIGPAVFFQALRMQSVARAVNSALAMSGLSGSPRAEQFSTVLSHERELWTRMRVLATHLYEFGIGKALLAEYFDACRELQIPLLAVAARKLSGRPLASSRWSSVYSQDCRIDFADLVESLM